MASSADKPEPLLTAPELFGEGDAGPLDEARAVGPRVRTRPYATGLSLDPTGRG